MPAWCAISAAGGMRARSRSAASRSRTAIRWAHDLNVVEALIHSSNTVTARIADALGPERMRRTMIDLGMNERPYIELPAKGFPIWPGEKWPRLRSMTVGYGHGIAVTPLHLASAYAAMVNGGIWRPATLKKLGPGEAPRGRRVFKASTSSRMRQLLRAIAVYGTGKNADAPGYRVGGKTGSAEKPGGSAGYRKTALVSTFAAAFPMDRPRYVVIAMLDEPARHAGQLLPAHRRLERRADRRAPGAAHRPADRRAPRRYARCRHFRSQAADPGGEQVKLAKLCAAAGLACAGDANVTGFAIDNRKVAPGTVFGAFQGLQVNGEDFIPAAIESRGHRRGRAARSDGRRRGPHRRSDAAPRFRGARRAFFTPVPDHIVAVTGTNGKTSTVEMTRQIWRMAGERAASIGTFGVTTPDESVSTGLTTPDIVTFLSNLSGLAREGVTHVAYEASSHGLAQFRNEGVPVMAAGFTNFSRDHLDYHADMEDYFAAKMRLFDEVVTDVQRRSSGWGRAPAAGMRAWSSMQRAG